MGAERLTVEALEARLEGQRQQYRARLPAELDAMCELVRGVAGGHPQQLEALRLRLHRLAGSGGTFGLADLSRSARALEREVEAMMRDAAGAAALYAEDWYPRIQALGDSLVVVAPRRAAIGVAGDAGATAVAVGATVLWLVTDLAAELAEFVTQLESFGYRVRHFRALDDAEAAAADGAVPDMLIIDVLLAGGSQDSTARLPACPALAALDVPLLFVSDEDDFGARVRASRLGAEGFVLRPIDVARIVHHMDGILLRRHAPARRVLIVDDDIDLAEHYRTVLRGAGMEAEVLPRPDRLLERMSAFRPEVVLMDLHMPHYSGTDLAGVIRQLEAWAGLPIIYLSAEADPVRQLAAMDRGADDFLTKPISENQLIGAVRVRVDRARELAAQIARDGLTGLLKHAAIKEVVALEVARARREREPLVVAMIDIDHFKSVNDTHGHAAGDLVISSLAMLLSRRLRRSDAVGRYGGEEFVAVLGNCRLAAGEHLIEGIRRSFEELRFGNGASRFSCTVSVGLADLEAMPDASASELLGAADNALYCAKRAGRNRTCKAGGAIGGGRREAD